MLQHTPSLAKRPSITVTNTTAAQIMGETISILLKSQEAAPRLFTQRGGVWVRLRDAGAGELEVLTRDALKLEMDRAIEFRVPSERGNSYTVAPPPRDLVNGILSADRYPDVPELPELRRVATAPYFTADGELVLQPGYHAR